MGVAIFDLMKDPLYEDRVRLSIELTQFVVVVELRCLHVARKLPSFLNVFSSQGNFDWSCRRDRISGSEFDEYFWRNLSKYYLFNCSRFFRLHRWGFIRVLRYSEALLVLEEDVVEGRRRFEWWWVTHIHNQPIHSSWYLIPPFNSKLGNYSYCPIHAHNCAINIKIWAMTLNRACYWKFRW